MTHEWFTMNHITRKAVIVDANDIMDARAQANTIIGPETAPYQIGATPRPRKIFDRFPDATVGTVFTVPAR